MLFSSEIHTINGAIDDAAASGILMQTSAQRWLNQETIEPISYFELGDQYPTLGRTVIGFVQLDNRGFLDEGTEDYVVPRLYGAIGTVLPESDKLASNPKAQKVASEYQVIAEDLAMHRGVLTRYGRSSAEQFMLSRILGAHRPGYISARLSHLEAVREYVNAPRQARMNGASERKLAELATLEAILVLKDAA